MRSDKNCLSKRRNLVPLVYVSRYLLVSLLDSWLPCTLEMTVHYRETWTKIAFRYGVGGQGGGKYLSIKTFVGLVLSCEQSSFFSLSSLSRSRFSSFSFLSISRKTLVSVTGVR